jgi:hypothetical protein
VVALARVTWDWMAEQLDTARGASSEVTFQPQGVVEVIPRAEGLRRPLEENERVRPPDRGAPRPNALRRRGTAWSVAGATPILVLRYLGPPVGPEPVQRVADDLPDVPVGVGEECV